MAMRSLSGHEGGVRLSLCLSLRPSFGFRFPSFLCAGIGQMLATVSILFVASSFRIVSVPSFDRSIPRK
uniref:Uncharacterized protein n=1 Tax=Parascaris univalens TaxID=6257 RepID=A0A915A5M5_PARUN